MEFIYDLKNGPLDEYRKRATFHWKSLKIHLEGEDFVKSQNKLWTFMENSPEFKHPSRGLSLDEIQRRCCRQVKALSTIEEDESNTWFFWLILYDPSLLLLRGLNNRILPKAILGLGTERHLEFIKNLVNRKFIGCLSITEISHGTNTRGIQTTATYDVQTESFILNTPDFKAAKCWTSLLGKVATHAVLYANLITPDNVNNGLHPFIVPVRDPETFLPLPGIIVGDMGEKIGLNGYDNGFMMMKNYSIPRQNLLNRAADVTKEGKYTTSFKTKNERFGATLHPLTKNRIEIAFYCTMYSRLSLTIAIRYCAIRRQFGPSEKQELPVIEYQIQQNRLFPHLAALYAWTIFGYFFLRRSKEELRESKDPKLLAAETSEMHALSSAAKPLSTWSTQDAIQDCREACGGHGYLKATRFGEIRAANDAVCSIEGENSVLIQQASNWLLNQWDNFKKGKGISSPLGTATFMRQAVYILSLKFHSTTIEETLKLENLLLMHKWLICYYLKKTYQHRQSLRKQGMNSFETKNNSQTYFARTLSLVYAEHAVVKIFIDRIQEPDFKESERQVLIKLCALFSAWSLEKRLGDFYAGGFATPNSKLADSIRSGIISICKDLVSEAVALVDVLAPPDFIINSPLGMSDGEIYKHLEETFFRDPENFERPSWWQELRSNL